MTTDKNRADKSAKATASEGAAFPVQPDPERVAQLIAHRAVHSAEHNPEAGRIHGYCLVCGIPWPCEYAGTPPIYRPKAKVDLAAAARVEEGFAALAQRPAEVAIVCDWKDADPFPRFIEAEVGGKSVSLEWRDRSDGLKELIVPAATPPASIPAAESSGTESVPRGYVPVSVVQALVERWRAGASVCSATEYGEGARDALNQAADELAKLARDYAPEVSPKPPSPRNPE